MCNVFVDGAIQRMTGSFQKGQEQLADGGRSRIRIISSIRDSRFESRVRYAVGRDVPQM
jgi:hypothetical protein